MDLFKAAKANDFTRIDEILTSDINSNIINDRDDNGLTALHIAVTYGHIEATIKLIKHNALLNLADYENGWTPLHRSFYFNHFKLSCILILAGAQLAEHETPQDYKTNVLPRKERWREIKAIDNWKQGIDHDGNSPLDLLSSSLSKHLAEAKENLQCTNILSFGKADFILGVPLPKASSDIFKPKCVQDLLNETVVEIATNKYHSIALTTLGEIFTWGHGRSGRLGHGDEVSVPSPLALRGLNGIKFVTVAAGLNHTLALTEQGAVFSWGNNRFGQLGIGVINDANGSKALVPTIISSLKKVNVVGIAAGDAHSLCFTDKCELFSWGSNKHGQLGLQQVEVSIIPGGGPGISSPKRVQVADIMKFKATNRWQKLDPKSICFTYIKQISAAYNSSLLLFCPQESEPPQIYQWGHGSCTPCRIYINKSKKKERRNSGSDFGNESSWHHSDSSKVIITQVSCGEHHNVAISSTGGVYTWGMGGDQLGHGPEENIFVGNSPKLIESLLPENGGGRAVYVAATSNRTCVVSDTGDLYVWGSTDEQGILSPGYEKYQPIPKRVIGIKRAVSVAVGEDHTLVLTAASIPTLPYEDLIDESLYVKDQIGLTESIDPNNSFSFEVDDNKVDDNKMDDNNDIFYKYVPSLQSLCEREVAKGVDTRNVISLLSYAEDACCSELGTFCSEFIVRNLDAILVQNRQSDLELLAGGLADSLSAIKCRSRGASIDRQQKLSIIDSDLRNRSGSLRCKNSNNDISDSSASIDKNAFMSLNTVDSVNKKIRATKKKIKEIEDLDKKINTNGFDLSKEQQEKISKREFLELELKRLDLILNRLEGEERIRLQAEKGRELHPKVEVKLAEEIIPIIESQQQKQPKRNKSIEKESNKSQQNNEPRQQKKTKFIPLAVFESKQSTPPSFSDWENIVSTSNPSQNPATAAPATPKRSNSAWTQSPISNSKNVSLKDILQEERARTSSIGSSPASKMNTTSKFPSSPPPVSEVTLGSWVPKKKSESPVSCPWNSTPNKAKSLSQIQEEELKSSNPTDRHSAWFTANRPRAESLEAVMSEQAVAKQIELEKKSIKEQKGKKKQPKTEQVKKKK